MENHSIDKSVAVGDQTLHTNDVKLEVPVKLKPISMVGLPKAEPENGDDLIAHCQRNVYAIWNISPNVFQTWDGIQCTKDVLLETKYSNSSSTRATMCPFCEKECHRIREHLERQHPLMFRRGCIYCGCEITSDNLMIYKTHIEDYHSEEILKPRT